MSNKPIAWYADRYASKFAMALVPIEPGRKFPTATDWGNQVITDPEAASRYYTAHPDWNMGLALGPAGYCSLDIDCMESFQTILDEFGIPPEEMEQYPTIQGASKGMRLLFRVPADTKLPYCKLTWPVKDDAKKNYTVIELRAATDGKQRQDVLPPSIHPDTKKPYRWLVQPPQSVEVWPEPPGWLLAMWGAWDQFKPQLKDACPWAEKPEPPKPKAQRRVQNQQGGSIIESYNRANNLAEHLDRYGYKRKGRTRYLSPHSTTNLPGVVLFPGGESCWVHHASDPLCSEETGQPVSAFDLYCHYEHGDDASKACKELAKDYGNRPTHNPPSNVVPLKPVAEVPEQPTLPTQQAVDIYSPLPWAKDNGTPYKHVDNLREICRRLNVIIRYNEIKKEEEILIPGKGFSRDNEANATLAWLKSECSLFKYPADTVQDYLTILADENIYSPVRAWVGSKPWDGVDRMQQLCDTVKMRGEDQDDLKRWLKQRLIRRWMLSAIAAGFSSNGVSAHGVLVFQGDQYLGKTKWFKQLVPSDLDLIKDGMMLRPDDKDSVKQACSYWIVELGELDSTFKRADIAQLKAFVTSDQDVLRKPYAKRESRYARRTVFFASVNPREFLHDSTGNRRYWTIDCEYLDHSHDIDMQQCWAQAYELWRKGEGHFLMPDEMEALNDHNHNFMASDPIEERILSGFEWSDVDAAGARWLTPTEVLQELGIDRPTRAESTTAAHLIRQINGGQGKRTGSRRLLKVPPKRFN